MERKQARCTRTNWSDFQDRRKMEKEALVCRLLVRPWVAKVSVEEVDAV